MQKSKFNANKLLKQLREHGSALGGSEFELCQIFSAFKSQRLYELLGYESYGDFIDNAETNYPPYKAALAARVYEHSRRLKYKKSEMIEMLSVVGLVQTNRILRALDSKITLSSVRRRSREYYKKHAQINFVLDPDTLDRFESLLIEHGMEISESGYRCGATDALINALNLNGKKSKAA